MKEVEKHTTCPFCSANHDRATNATGQEQPDDGDITLCFSCGEWAVFDSGLPTGMRKPNDKEYEEIGADKRCRKLRAGWLQVKQP